MNRSEVRAVAFAFTRPDAVVYIGKGWTDAKGRRYRIHVYPSVRKDSTLQIAKDRPNVILLRRADKATSLNEYASKLHRIIFLGSPDELVPLGIPILDVIKDDKGKLISAPPRANVDYYNRRIEDDAIPFDLTPHHHHVSKSEESKKERKRGEKKKIPQTLSDFLDEIEPNIGDGDEWEDMEKPVLSFFLGHSYQKDFESSCKNLVRLGVDKKLCRTYYRWVALEEPGLSLSAAFEIVVRSLDDGISFDIRSLAKRSGVNPNDLSVLYNLYKSELKEKE